MLAYITDDIVNGQVSFYSFDTYSLSGSAMNPFVENGVSTLVALVFDYDSNMLNCLDSFGNNYNIIYSAQRTNDNSVSIDEINEGLTKAPVDQVLEFNTNTLYIHNGLFVWKFNFNLHLRPFQRLLVNNLDKFVLMQTPNGISLFFTDYGNSIFLYKNYMVTFSTHFEDQITCMKQITQSNTFIVLFVFESYILTYINQDYFSSDNYSAKLHNVYMKKFELIELDRVIFTTHQNVLIDYDFYSNKSLFSVQLEFLDDIMYSASINNQLEWLFLYGTITGKIGIYDIKTQTHIIYSGFLSQVSPIIQILKIQDISSNSPSKVLVVHKSGKVITLNISTNPLSLQLSVEQSFSHAIERGLTSLQEIQVISIDSNNNRYFVNFKGDKTMFVWNLQTHQFIQFLSFPDDEWKRIDINEQFILLSASSQLNIYDISAEMNFVTRIRRYNRKDRITDIRMIGGNKLIVVFTNRVETLLIQATTYSVIVMDSVVLVDSHLMYAQIIQLENRIRLIGIAKTQVFEKSISIGLYEQSKSSCVSSLTYTENASAQNAFELTYSPTVSNINFLISVHMSGGINSLSFLNKPNVQIILRSLTSSDRVLNIDTNSFVNLSFNLQISGFTVSFTEQGNIIAFNPNTINIIFQDLVFQNCDIMRGTSLSFANKKLVTIQNIAIQNVHFSPPNVSTRGMSSLLVQSIAKGFLSFSSCEYVLLDTIDITDSSFGVGMIFVSSKNSTVIIIKQLNIVRSSLSGLLQFTQDKSVQIISLTITDCVNLSPIFNYEIYLLNFIGVQQIILSSLRAERNRDLLLLQTNKTYQLDYTTISLKTDSLQIVASYVKSHQFTNFTQDKQINLIKLTSSYIFISDMYFGLNQGNTFVYSAVKLQVSKGTFQLNQGVIGSCLQAQDITEQLSITSSSFDSNKALASGGALYLLEVTNPSIDNITTITNNAANIGGGIRILSRTQSYIDVSVIKAQMIGNSASMFGDQIATYLNSFQIFQRVLDESQTYYSDSLVYQGEILSPITPKPIVLTSIQSGGQLQLNIKLLDQYDRIFNFDPHILFNSQYSILLLQELDTYIIEMSQVYLSESSSNESQIEIKGESLITSKQFDSKTQSFQFKALTLTSKPQSIFKNALLKLKFNPNMQSQGVNTILQFRDCFAGEIYVKQLYQSQTSSNQSSGTIIGCYKCESGTYSLRNKDTNQMSQEDKEEIYSHCLKCPSSANQCVGDTIFLRQGYWRESTTSDNIIQCNSIRPEVCEEDNEQFRYGCSEGYVGPLCETCDSRSIVWNNDRYIESHQVMQCTKCSESALSHLLFLIFSSLFIIGFIFLGVCLFMGYCFSNARCKYLRLMSILPIVKSSLFDQSIYFIKALINYLQLSQPLFSLSFSGVPTCILLLPTILGQPITRILLSSACIFDVSFYSQFGDERIRAYFHTLYPLIIILIIVTVLSVFQKYNILEVTSSHRYTLVYMAFSFFQPDCVAFFTQALSCRTIGDKQYQSINLLIPCSDPSYNSFNIYFLLPNLLFWLFSPVIIFWQLRKDMKKDDETLQFLSSLTRYGYFYLGLKKSFYYWEFIRIYFKVIIILLIYNLRQYEIAIYLHCLILICIYILIVQKIKPFESNSLQQLEILSYGLLIPNIFCSQVNKISPFQGFSLLIILLHFGYIAYSIFIILKFKLNSNTSSRIIPYIRSLLHKTLPEYLYISLTSDQSTNSFRAIKRWKHLSSNIHIIRLQAATSLSHPIQSKYKKRIQLGLESIHQQEMSADDNSKIEQNFELSHFQGDTKQTQNIQKCNLEKDISKMDLANSNINLIFSKEISLK